MTDGHFFAVLPQSLSGAAASGPQLSHIIRSKNRLNNLRDLFVPPPFDELDAVAMDGTGEPRRLTNTQLKSLRERGFVFLCFTLLYILRCIEVKRFRVINR